MCYNLKTESNMKNQLLIILFLINIFSVKSQESNIGNWLIYFGNKDLNSSFNWHHEIQHRNYNILGELEQLLVRTGLGYNVNENNNILLGYGFIDSRNKAIESNEILKVNEQNLSAIHFKQVIGKINSTQIPF